MSQKDNRDPETRLKELDLMLKEVYLPEKDFTHHMGKNYDMVNLKAV